MNRIASAQRVLALHQQHPDKPADELVELVIRNSCMQVASQSAANAGLAVLPALSIIGALAVGALANQINTTHQRQAELVLDIATIYRYPFRPNEKPFYLAVATMANLSDTMMEGFDQGAQQVGRAAGRATRKFLDFWRNATTPKE